MFEIRSYFLIDDIGDINALVIPVIIETLMYQNNRLIHEVQFYINYFD